MGGVFGKRGSRGRGKEPKDGKWGSEAEKGGECVDRLGWINIIRINCEQAGTYRPWFDNVISTLASILERRDDAEDLFVLNGSQVLVEHTNKAGATNTVQNPILRLINDLNRDALAYWRDLGLTPAGLKRIDEKAMKQKKISAMEKALSGFG